MIPNYRNNSDGVSNALNNSPCIRPRNTSVSRNNFIIDFATDKEKIEELENEKNVLLEENEKLRLNMCNLMKNFPKEIIFQKVIENKCPICLEDYKYNDKLILTNCLHVFHKECMNLNIDQDNTNCPKCRYEFNQSVFLNFKFSLEYDKTEIF